PEGKRSGLLTAIDVVKEVVGISFVYFNEKDVVRHHLVQRIIRAYELYSQNGGGSRNTGSGEPSATPQP
ncbi:MAG: PhoH family protein, partial [Acidobacteria bacterium]|nr:PhoH family protein [Acidobacteriota bacterium]